MLAAKGAIFTCFVILLVSPSSRLLKNPPSTGKDAIFIEELGCRVVIRGISWCRNKRRNEEEETADMSFRRASGGGGGGGGELSTRGMVSKKWTFLLCMGSFCVGSLFINSWTMPEAKDMIRATGTENSKMNLVSNDCNLRTLNKKGESKEILGKISNTPEALHTLDKTISNLEVELAAARAVHESILASAPPTETLNPTKTTGPRKYLMVVGINTAFSSRRRRDSVRATWMPQGKKRKKMEEEKGIIIRFVIGHSATPGGILDKAIEAEHNKHGDFMRLDHVEGCLELSAKTKIYFATAVSMWDADFYVKVDDAVHLNIETLGMTLAKQRRTKPRAYLGCMKSGPVLAQKGVRYHEPEYWKFGEEGNKYF